MAPNKMCAPRYCAEIVMHRCPSFLPSMRRSLAQTLDNDGVLPGAWPNAETASHSKRSAALDSQNGVLSFWVCMLWRRVLCGAYRKESVQLAELIGPRLTLIDACFVASSRRARGLGVQH